MRSNRIFCRAPQFIIVRTPCRCLCALSLPQAAESEAARRLANGLMAAPSAQATQPSSNAPSTAVAPASAVPATPLERPDFAAVWL